MRLDNLILIFIVHFVLSLLILAIAPLDSSDVLIGGGGALTSLLTTLRDYMFIPVRQILNTLNMSFEGSVKYVPYALNSFLWSLVINYLLILINDFLNPKRLS